MAKNIRALRLRIRSLGNTAKITKAMQMIAASKMRRAQEMVLAGRPYSEKIEVMLADLAAVQSQTDEAAVPLLEVRPVQKTALVLVTPDRGLCGGLHSNMNRAAGEAIRNADSDVVVITVGRKGRDFIVRSGTELLATFENVGDRPTLDDTRPISSIVIQEFEKRAIDRVWLGFSRFVNIGVQKPEISTLIPVEPAELEPGQAVDYIYEPSPRDVLEELLPRFVEMEIYHAILEAIASEHSARMVAMQNATDAANDLIDELTLVLNKARQESITSEILDIIGGVAAVER
ncbi:MAG: ATP synthase F1 subunit gamma [Chloroflexi bacterium]|nr:ATP synthase F1 subunit gamma [Chloroflexota bacterium]